MEGEAYRGRYKCYGTIGDILLIGESLRIRMHTDNTRLIRDRRYRFRTYSSVFSGCEAVDWLVCDTGQIPDRETATYLMNLLLENQILHHICDEQTKFKDDQVYYRFCKDDGTFRWHEDLALLLRAQRIFQRMSGQDNSVLKRVEWDGVIYKKAFSGCDLVDWLLTNNDIKTREEGLKVCRKMLENEIVKHITDDHHFKDEALLYQFRIDFSKPVQLIDLILPPDLDTFTEKPESLKKVASCSSGLSNSLPSSEAQRIPDNSNRLEHRESGYNSAPHSSPTDSEGTWSNGGESLEEQRYAVPQVIFRKATAEELASVNSPFVQKHIRILSDQVGFGFVIRGDSPVYIKAVDPTGPAALAGLKIGHYVYKVNDDVVLKMNHRQLAEVILDNMGFIDLTVMEHKDTA